MNLQANTRLDVRMLERAVKDMYQRVALEPEAEFHFELGRQLAERLGYSAQRLDAIPGAAIDSFAGVGHHFDLADLKPKESVLDLGSGSGMDAFVAATYVGRAGQVVGVDMTDAQRAKANRLRDEAGFEQVSFVSSYVEDLPFQDASFDCVISNGVINLVSNKEAVFRQAARVLKPGGRIALSDIVTSVHLPEGVTCNATLWAACIGGAMHRVEYQEALENAGFTIRFVKPNPQYQFLPGRARRSAEKYEVNSISLIATKN